MRLRTALLSVTALILIQGGAFGQASSDIASPGNVKTVSGQGDLILRGAKLYQRRCAACHSLDQNRIGPKHRGLYGRAAGSVADFRYSPALQRLNIIWTAETLDIWLKNPTAFAPGTAMGFRVADPDDRKMIILYLKSATDATDRPDQPPPH